MSDIFVESVSKSFGDKLVLRGLSHTFAAGQVHGITGPSGCGKTTLLNIILGLIPPDEGAVSGVDLKALSAVFQEDRLCEQATAEANVRMVIKKNSPVTELFNEIGFSSDIKTPFNEIGLRGCERVRAQKLSGGMKRRVALLRALAAPFSLLVMDEPFTGLDAAAKSLAADFVRRRLNGRTAIVVTHSEEDIGLLGGAVSLKL